jgi:hypothetical protein
VAALCRSFERRVGGYLRVANLGPLRIALVVPPAPSEDLRPPVSAASDRTTPGAGVPGGTPLIGIFGTPRSGSTWLGAILDSHPEVAYRFEPFHRLRSSPRIQRARELLASPDLCNADLPFVYNALLPAHPQLLKEPFFRKCNARNSGRRPIWALARKLERLAPACEWLYTPSGRPPLVFKEVSLARMVEQLVTRTAAQVVYVVRHPGAVVSSLLEGQARGLMETGLHAVLGDLLAAHDASLAATFVPRLDALGPVGRNALLWRIECERSLAAVRDRPNAKLVVYEELCRDPAAIARELFEFLALDYGPATEAFLGASTEPGVSPRGDASAHSYFSVYRNPLDSMDKWRRTLAPEARATLEEVLESSSAYQEMFERGHWS